MQNKITENIPHDTSDWSYLNEKTVFIKHSKLFFIFQIKKIICLKFCSLSLSTLPPAKEDDNDEGRRQQDPDEGVHRQTTPCRWQSYLVLSSDIVVTTVKRTTSPRSRRPRLVRNRDGVETEIFLAVWRLRFPAFSVDECSWKCRVGDTVAISGKVREIPKPVMRSRSHCCEPRTSPLSSIFSVSGDCNNSGETFGFWADLAGFGVWFIN